MSDGDASISLNGNGNTSPVSTEHSYGHKLSSFTARGPRYLCRYSNGPGQSCAPNNWYTEDRETPKYAVQTNRLPGDKLSRVNSSGCSERKNVPSDSLSSTVEFRKSKEKGRRWSSIGCFRRGRRRRFLSVGSETCEILHRSISSR